jgi:hypothetical protein
MVDGIRIKDKSTEGIKSRNRSVEAARGSQAILSDRDPLIRCGGLATGAVSGSFARLGHCLTRRTLAAASDTGNLQPLWTRSRAMEFLHPQEIVHRDFKTFNILPNSHNSTYVGAFVPSARRRSAAALALRTTLRRRFFSEN